LSQRIYPKTYQTGYERFRPNKSGHHLRCRCYRGGWHRSYPALIRLAAYTKQKPYPKAGHLEFPRHAFAHCVVFAPAAPRRAWGRVSAPISGLCLSTPVPITGLVVLYTTNNLIGRRLILRRRGFGRSIVPDIFTYQVLFPVSRDYP
jgi:hypothetical protein